MTNEPDVPPEKLDAPGEIDDASAPHDALFYRTFSKPEHAAALLKDVFKPALVAAILPKVACAVDVLLQQPHGRLVISGVMVYMKTVGKVSEEEVRVALQQSLGLSVAEQILYPERRVEYAERAGELRGELNGQRKILKQVLGQRFGALPPDAITRIDAASAADLDAMALRVLTAATLQEALGTPTPSRR